MRTVEPVQLSLLRALLAVLFAVASISHSASAQTPEQIEAFRNLPPDQQRAILDTVGEQGGAQRRDPQLATPQTTAPVPMNTPGQLPLPEPGPPKIGAGATLLFDVSLVEDPAPTEQRRGQLNARRDRIEAGNPYRLDEDGRLALPTLPPINLSGLTDLQAAQRLNADPRLSGLRFAVTLLPLEPAGIEALEPFGYDLFEDVPTTFAPATDIPVPSDYRIGPGDNFTVELFGKKTARYQLVVGRNGSLILPEFGPIQVTGLTYDEVREEIDRRIAEQMIGVRASVTMGQLRSVRIFLVGDVVRPGSYTVSALSTITNALLASGGVSKVGSLRDIQLKRGGRTVARLDLYDLLLRGDTSQDQQLQQGDAIFVPTIGSTAGIAGQVHRPAIYEFRSGTTVADLLQLSGGTKPEADTRFARIERIDPNRERTVINLDLATAADRARPLVAGDVVTVPRVLGDTRGVVLEGHVSRPGPSAWREGLRLTDLLGSLQVFKLNADQRYVLIRREHLPDRRIEVISADANAAFQAKGSDRDPLLDRGDRVIVFGRQPERGAALAEVLEEMRLQARDNSPRPVVSISGRVRAPGEYPLESNMTISDLVRAGGGLDEAAHATKAELTRYEVINNESRKTDVIDIDLAGATAEADAADMQLRPYDVVVVKETPDWREQESMTLSGEVRYPGTYPIRSGETLSSVIERAGGLTEKAFPKGSAFVREELKDQEARQIETLVSRLQADLALVALQGTQTGKESVPETLAAGQSLLTQLKSAKPTGRLVIDLERALASRGSADDIELRGGDRLVVPRFKPYVTVIGEVQNATSHVWKAGLSRDEYLQLSGGTTSRADDKRIYVVRANGSVVATSAGWFSRGTADLEPGDTIVVPIDAERMRPLTLWTAVTTIIYNLAVAVAAVNSF